MILNGKGSSNWLWSTWVQSRFLSFLQVNHLKHFASNNGIERRLCFHPRHFVCLLAGVLKKIGMALDDIFTNYSLRDKQQLIQFWRRHSARVSAKHQPGAMLREFYLTHTRTHARSTYLNFGE